MMFRSYSNISKYFLRDYGTIAMVIILVTMATPISSHVKDKKSTFTACDEDIIFLVKGEILVFHRCLCNKYILSTKRERSEIRTKKTKGRYSPSTVPSKLV